jgi:PAS domain S-box-containing protein
MENAIRILILEHDLKDLELLQNALKETSLAYVSEVVQTKETFEEALLEFKPDLILSESSLPTFEGLSAYKIKEQLRPETPFIIVSCSIGEDKVVELIKSGVTDFVLKEKLYQIEPKINRALKETEAGKQKEATEQYLRQRDEQLHNIMNLSLDLIYTVDQDGKFLTINPAAKLLLDYQPEELIGRNIIDFILEEDKNKTYTAFANLKYGIDIINLESRYLRKSGIPVTLLWSVRWHSDDTGYGVAKDITEVKKVGEKLKLSERRFKALLQNSSDGLTLLNEEGIVIERSPSAIKILGLDPEEVCGKFRADLVHPDDRNTMETVCSLVKQTPGIIKKTEYRMLMPNGNYKWIETTFHNQLAEPAINAIVLNFRDITERKLTELALKKSEIILKKGEEIAHLGSWQEDLTNGKTTWSEETYKILGLEPFETEPSFDLYFSFVHPEDRNTVKREIVNYRSRKSGSSFTHRIIRKDGEVRHIFAESKYEFDPESKDTLLYGVLLDITNQKKTQEKLSYSEARLKEAQAIGKIGNWEVNYLNGRSEWSDEIFRIYGLQKDTTVINPEMFMSFVYPEDREYVLNKVRSTQALYENGSVDFRFIRTNGELRYGYSEWRYKVDEKGNIISMFGILQDITEQKLAELALEQSEEKYRSIFQLSPLPMWVFDVETYRFLNVNEAAIRHYGYSKEEFLAMTIKDIRPEEDINKLEETIRTNKKTGNFYQSFSNHQKKNGEKIQVEIQSNMVDYEGKNARLVLATDISERIKYIHAIEEQNKKLREIAWIQSHVVRAPLARMMGLISLLQQNSVKEENIPELVGYLTSSANELDTVIRGIIKETDNIELKTVDGKLV